VGLWSEFGYSDGIKVDTTPPVLPYRILDGGPNTIRIVDGVYSVSLSALRGAWGLRPSYGYFDFDPESGVEEFQYKITQDSPIGQVIRDWASTLGINTLVTGLNLQQAKTYYFTVKAKNRAGLWSGEKSSNGVTVDVTPPTTPVVSDQGVYTSSTTTLYATWSSNDPESGIDQYIYRITQDSPTGTVIKGGASINVTTSLTVTGLALQPGKTYYFGVRVRNKAELWSSVGYSDGIIVKKAASSVSASAVKSQKQKKGSG